jgi:lambda family phage portal protein
MKRRILDRLSAAGQGLAADLRRLPLGGAIAGLLFGQRSFFQATEMSRKFMDWISSTISADKEIQGDMRKLRGRARDLGRNDAHTKRILKLLKANVVGHRGIRLQAQVRKKDNTLDTETNKKIEAAFTQWAEEPNEVSADGKLDWLHFQQQVIGDTARDGETIIRLLPGFNSRFQMAMEFIDPDRLSEQHNVPGDDRRGINEIRMGIERDKWGRPVAYHILTAHPSDSAQDRKTVRVPAEQIIHIYTLERATQSRGISWLAPIMRDLKIMDGYFEAELIASRLSAARMGFIETDADSWAGPGDPPIPQMMDAAPGTVGVLPPGARITSWGSDHPSTAFPSFVKAVLRRISSGVNAAYNLVANDLEGVSYSSIRQGELNGRDEWRLNQAWLAAFLHRRVYREWLRMAILTGNLKLPTYKPADYHAVVWRPRGWSWVDPLKDQQANILAIEAGLTSPQDVVAEEGEDYEEIQERLVEAAQIRAKHQMKQADKTLEMVPGAVDPETEALAVKKKAPAAPAPGAEASAAAGATTVQDTALNGAQVTALLEIVSDVVAGKLPKATAEAMILAAFPAISPERVTAMLSGLDGFEPAVDPAKPAATPPAPPAADPIENPS